MNRLATTSLLTLVLAQLGCANLPERLTVLPGPTAPVASTTCDASIRTITPDGTLPASRTSPIVIAYSGHALAGSVKVRVTGPGGEVPAELLLSAGSLEVRPDAPWAPGPHLVEASVCDSHAVRSFEVGSVHHPLADGDWSALAGERFELDLRYGSWAEPAAREGRELILRNLFASAIVVHVVKASEDELVAAIGPAMPASGDVVPANVAGEPAASLLLDNPYALASFDSLDLTASHRALALHEGSLVLGLTREGLTDVRLSAEVDLRDFGTVDGLAACELLELHSFGGCAPCVSDEEPSCFSLTLEGMASHR